MGNTLRKMPQQLYSKACKIRIKVEIRALEWSTFINEFIDKKRFEAVILGWSIGLDPDQYDIWHSSRQKKRNLISLLLAAILKLMNSLKKAEGPLT